MLHVLLTIRSHRQQRSAQLAARAALAGGGAVEARVALARIHPCSDSCLAYSAGYILQILSPHLSRSQW